MGEGRWTFFMVGWRWVVVFEVMICVSEGGKFLWMGEGGWRYILGGLG